MVCVSPCFISLCFSWQKLRVHSGNGQKHMFSPGIAQVPKDDHIKLLKARFNGCVALVEALHSWMISKHNEPSLHVLQVGCIFASHCCMADLQDGFLDQPFFGSSHWNFITEHGPYSYTTSVQKCDRTGKLSTMRRWVLCQVTWFLLALVLFCCILFFCRNKARKMLRNFCTSRIWGDVISGKSHWVWWRSQWDAPDTDETKRPKLDHRLSWSAVEGKNRVLEIFHGVLACLETGALSSVALYSRIDPLAS